jgi:sugar/nucleoside kinase (ribokinase family)
MGRDLQILGFGAVAVDDILYVNRPFAAGKGKVTRRIAGHGGNVATALVTAARLGARTGFIGWLGDAETADPSAADLARNGVDISLAPRRADAGPIRSVIIVAPDGERFIAYDDAVPHGTADSLPNAVLAQAKILLIDAYAIHAAAVVARARSLGVVVVADIEWTIGPPTVAVLAQCDHLVVPLRFAEALAGNWNPAEMLASLWSVDRTAVVLTDGDRGAYLRHRDDAVLWHVPAHRVTPVDTTGAGDCFHGAYAYALLAGKSPVDCVRFASAAAAISVTGEGGRSALPDLGACLALMTSGDAPMPVAMARIDPTKATLPTA